MPGVAKTLSPRKSGVPKAKGTVRAKSGCYTCRIRRKKCDEQSESGSGCHTCQRLKLECLGFGSKRPEYLRDSTMVAILRDKIKAFLSSQGMIKGCSGTGPRGGSDEPAFLRLSPPEDIHTYSSSSESPPSHRLSLSPPIDDYSRSTTLSAPRWEVSSPPLDPGMYTISEDDMYNPSCTLVSSSGLRPASRPGSPFDTSSSQFPDSYADATLSSASVVPWVSPAVATSFGSSYSYQAPIDDLDMADDVLPTDVAIHWYISPTGFIDELVQHYMKTVVGLQYQLADRGKLTHILLSAITMTSVSRDAARLLASVHCLKYQAPHHPALKDPSAKYKYRNLRDLIECRAIGDDEAMAALNVVSTFLFDGGKGEWDYWIGVAEVYCRSVIYSPRFLDPTDALLHCTEKEQFLVKTSMWFDVLASISTMQPPRLLDVVRTLFNPASSSIVDLSQSPRPEASMTSAIGCDNVVFWALAETSALAEWKAKRIRQGNLSVPDLVAKGKEIETALHNSLSSFVQSYDPVDISRNYTAKIFRCASLVYLRSVVSGDHPQVREIADAVDETVQCMMEIRNSHIHPRIGSSVVRSTVFPIFICGALTENPRHRIFLSEQLQCENGPGNCQSTTKMLNRLWDQADSRARGNSVGWRELLLQEKMLLV